MSFEKWACWALEGSVMLDSMRRARETEKRSCRDYWKEELRIMQGHDLFHSSFHISLALFTLTLVIIISVFENVSLM